MKVALVLTTILLVLWPSSEALECVQCRTEGCLEPILECPPGGNFCHEYMEKVDGKTTVYARQCTAEMGPEGCFKYGSQETCSAFCNYDGCHPSFGEHKFGDEDNSVHYQQPATHADHDDNFVHHQEPTIAPDNLY